MANKYPWIKFWPEDWAHDLIEHPLEIEGAWIRIITSKLWWSDNRGEKTLPISEWSNLLRLPVPQTCKTLAYLQGSRIADVMFSACHAVNPPNPCHANVTPLSRTITDEECNNCNALVTIISRRISREVSAKEKNRLRQQKHRQKLKSNGLVTLQEHIIVTGEKLEARGLKRDHEPQKSQSNAFKSTQEDLTSRKVKNQENQNPTSPAISKLVTKSLENTSIHNNPTQGLYICHACHKPARLLRNGICVPCYKAKDPNKKAPANVKEGNDL